MSARSPGLAGTSLVFVRRMKKATTSTDASLFSHWRSARTSFVGRPAT